MKQFLLALLFSPMLSLQAQKFEKLPKFGKVDVDALKMKECEFDKKAGAMVIFDEAESFITFTPANAISPILEQTEHRTRIKIFNKNSFDQANIKIKYRNDASINIKKLQAQTYNLDATGNIVSTKVDKASIYDKEINKRYREKIFAFPDVKEGSIIEFEYTLDGASEEQWYFQHNIPTQYSRFIVNFPQEIVFAATPYCTLPLIQDSKTGIQKLSWYAMQNVPAFVDEAFMSNKWDYLQRLELQIVKLSFSGIPDISFVKTWPEIIKDLIDDEDFGRQLKKDLPRTSELDIELAKITDDVKKMKLIHAYVRNNMKWNDRESIWALDGVKKAWKDKLGTSGEINLILINLLRDAGLKVKPMLVSTKQNGAINTAVAGYDQFDRVLAYVEIEGKIYILDATEKTTPSHIIPLNVLASEGLLIGKLENYEWGWKVIWDDKNKFAKSIYLNAEINDNNKLNGLATIVSHGYQKIEDLNLLKAGVDKFKQEKKLQPGVTIDSLVLTNELIDSLPLKQQFTFSVPTNASGNLNYFSLNHFAGFNKNPFLTEDRVTEIFFGALQDYAITSFVSLPTNYEFDELPKNIKMMTSDSSIIFQRRCQQANGLLNVQVSIKFNNPVYSQDSYPEIREFYKKMLELLEDKFVYKKK